MTNPTTPLYYLFAALHSALGVGRAPISRPQLARLIRDAGPRGITCRELCLKAYPWHTVTEVSRAIASLSPGLMVRYTKAPPSYHAAQEARYVAKACNEIE